jgi:predicted Zn finger-like uncharacterized protein
MNLTTHCPRCATAFLVTQEQLGEAQGWVRCGMCQEVFIAQAHTAAPAQTQSVEAPLPHQRAALPDDDAALDDDIAPAPGTTPKQAASLPLRPEPRQTPSTRPTQSKTTSRPRGRSAPLVLGALLLVMALQFALQARHSLANAFPKVTSVLQSLCPPDRCGLRQISAVAIEDSNFTTTGPNLFHLSATIANLSGLMMDAPALALTLTDATDQVLARKVYAPKDWGAEAATLSGEAKQAITLWIKWEDASSTQRVVGYRLQAFYP